MTTHKLPLVVLVIQLALIVTAAVILIRWSDLDGGAVLNRELWDTTFAALDQLDHEGLITIDDDNFRDATGRITGAISPVAQRRLLPPEPMLVLGAIAFANLVLVAILLSRSVDSTKHTRADAV